MFEPILQGRTGVCGRLRPSGRAGALSCRQAGATLRVFAKGGSDFFEYQLTSGIRKREFVRGNSCPRAAIAGNSRTLFVSGIGELNPCLHLGRVMLSLSTNPANFLFD